jgi:hypothetical protein
MVNKKKRFIYYSSPENWFQAALELNEAVEELYLIREKAHYYQTFHFENQTTVKRPIVSRATYLLMSYALENLLKGIAVLNNPELVNKGKLQKEIKTHDLNELSKLNRFRLNDEQKEFQSVLSTQCVSNARYPVGLNEQIALTDPLITKKDYFIYENLFKKYKRYLAKEFNKKGWESGLNDSDLRTEPGEFKFFENKN